MLKNDWIVASINNPYADIYDLTTSLELTENNTQFLSKDRYLKSDYIKNHDLFKDSSGNFDELLFDNFYNIQLQRWSDFQEDNFNKGVKLDYFDTDYKPSSRVKDPEIKLETIFNPDKLTYGIEGFDIIGERTKSAKEIAQGQQVYDSETGTYLDYTPDETSLFSNPVKWFKNLFSDPLVLATYDEDTIDENGKEHKKGEYKYNNFGTYYYETLNGRSSIGKEVLSIGDNLTKEDSFLNSIDFFDSDDLKKSAAGVVAKNIAIIAPLFTPAAPYYMYSIIAKELVKTLPMLYGFSTSLLNTEATPEWINTIAAKAELIGTGVSEYSKQNVFTFENVGNLLSDVVLQYGQQQQIMKSLSYFRKDFSKLDKAKEKAFDLYKSKIGVKYDGLKALDDADWENSVLGQMCLQKIQEPVLKQIKKNQKLSADLSLLYMSLISNTDVYSTMLDKGATKKEAAAVALGSTLGMFGFDKYTGLGELLFDELGSESIRQGRKIFAKEVADAVSLYGTKKTSKNLFAQGLTYGKNATQNFVQNLKDRNLGVFGKSLGEALEETGEELITDLSKYAYVVLGDLGLYDRSVENPIDFDTMGERYAMSFLGGALGGGLFFGINKYKTFDKTRDLDAVDYIREYGLEPLLKVSDEEIKKGNVAATELSGTDYTYQDGNLIFTTTKNENESQNQIVGNLIKDKFKSIAATLGNKYNLSDDELFDKMVFREARYHTMKNASYITGYYQEIADKRNDYLDAVSNLKQAENSKTGLPEDTSEKLDNDKSQDTNREINIQDLKDKVSEAKKALDEALTGNFALEYTRKLNFILDPVLNSVFLGIDKYKWFMDKITSIESISDKEQLLQQWNDYVKNKMSNINPVWNAFKKLESVLIPKIENFNNTYENYKTSLSQLQDFQNIPFLSEYLEKHPYYTYDSKLSDETDEEYKNRYNEDLIQTRADKIEALNNQIILDYYNTYLKDLANLNLSGNSMRLLSLQSQIRNKDIISVLAKKHNINGYVPNLDKVIEESVLKYGIENRDRIVNKSIDFYQNYIENNIIYNDESSIPSNYWDLTFEQYSDLTGKDVSKYINIFGNNVTIESATDIEEIQYLPQIQQNIQNIQSNIALLLNNYQDNPLTSITQAFKSPLEEIFGTISETVSKDSTQLFNLNSILEKIWKSYSTTDLIEAFELTKGEEEQLDNAFNILELVKAYIYAASGNKNSFFGQNKQINEFVEKHKNEISNWNPLPVIAEDYATELIQEAENYQREINIWKQISSNNRINKIGRLDRIESLVQNLQFNFLKNLSIAFTIDDEEYTIKPVTTGECSLQSLYEAERSVYIQFQKILEKVDINTLITKTNFLEQLLGTNNFEDIIKQKISNLNESLKEFTTYDKLIYFTTIVSQNPNNYYENILKFTQEQTNIVPLTVQLLDSRIGESLKSSVFKQMIEEIGKYIGIDAYIASNSIHINGVAGAGKTDVVLKKIKQQYEGQKVAVVAPTSLQSNKLQTSLNESTSYNFDQFFSNAILNYSEIKKEYDELIKKVPKNELNKNEIFNIQGEFIQIKQNINTGSNNGLGITVFVKPEKIQFNPDFKHQVIFVDEAAHMNTMEIVLVDQFAKYCNAEAFLASDNNQMGYQFNKLENLQDYSIFTTRTYKLQESLRSNNIQKQENDYKINAILDTATELLQSGDQDAFISYINKIKDTLKNLDLRLYKETDINGYWLNPDLDEVISKLPKNANVGFIGDESSEVFQKLKNLNIVQEALTSKKIGDKPFMQGQEFDYVIVQDDIYETIQNNYTAILFIRKLNTLATRARKGVIFLDKKLTEIVGENKLDNIKSAGFDIKEQVEVYRPKFIKKLEELKLIPLEEVQQDENIIDLTELEQYNDDTTSITETTAFEDSEIDSSIKANTVFPIIGLPKNENGDWIVNRKFEAGKIYKNLSAIDLGIDVISDYNQKIKAQSWLEDIQSYILFEDGKPDFIPENYELVLEAREVSDTDYFGVNSDLEEKFISYKGKNYVVSIVCKFKINNYTAAIDIALLEDINKFADSEYINTTKDLIDDKVNRKIITQEKANEEKKNLDTVYNKYINLLEKLLVNPINLQSGQYKKYKYSKLRKRKKPIRLGGKVDIEAVNNHSENTQNNKNYRNIHRRNKISRVYLVSNKSKRFSDKNKNKVVIFQSSKKSLKENDLAAAYLQNLNSGITSPEIRMIPLTNFGLTFTDVLTNRVVNQVGGEQPHVRKIMGLRMFKALWNFRSDLLNFKTKYESWKKELNLDDNQVDEILQVERTYFETNNPNILNSVKDKYGNDVIKKLTDFNQEVCKNISTFRLGNHNGKGYVRQLGGKNYLFLDNDLMNKYIEYLNIIHKQLSTNFDSEYNLFNTKIINPKTGNEYNPKEHIEAKIKTENKETKIQVLEKDEFGNSAEWEVTDSFSFYPRVLFGLLGSVKYKETNDVEPSLISIKTGESEYVYLNVDDLVGHSEEIFTMINQAFHGTIENIYDRQTKKISGVPYPNGIYVDPDIEYISNLSMYNQNLGGENGQNYDLIPIQTSENYFTVDVDVVPGGVELYIDKILKNDNEVQETKPIIDNGIFGSDLFTENTEQNLNELQLVSIFDSGEIDELFIKNFNKLNYPKIDRYMFENNEFIYTSGDTKYKLTTFGSIFNVEEITESSNQEESIDPKDQIQKMLIDIFNSYPNEISEEQKGKILNQLNKLFLDEFGVWLLKYNKNISNSKIKSQIREIIKEIKKCKQ